METSPSDERREVPLPSLVTVSGHNVLGVDVHTTRDDHCVCVGNTAGISVRNTVSNLNFTELN